jgi:hypothetical protein
MALSQMDHFSGKKQHIQSWDYPPQCPVLDYQDFQITGHWIKGISLYFPR